MSDDGLDKARILIKRFKQEMADMGLEVHQSSIIVGEPGDPDYLHSIMLIQPKAVTPEKTPEQLADEKAVEDMFKATHDQELTERAAQIKDEVAGWLDE